MALFAPEAMTPVFSYGEVAKGWANIFSLIVIIPILIIFGLPFFYCGVRSLPGKLTTKIIIGQNGFQKNDNIIKLQQKADSEGNQRVIFGGGAIKRIEGEYYL